MSGLLGNSFISLLAIFFTFPQFSNFFLHSELNMLDTDLHVLMRDANRPGCSCLSHRQMHSVQSLPPLFHPESEGRPLDTTLTTHNKFTNNNSNLSDKMLGPRAVN